MSALTISETGSVRLLKDGRIIQPEADCTARKDASGACTAINGTRVVTEEAGPAPEPEKP